MEPPAHKATHWPAVFVRVALICFALLPTYAGIQWWRGELTYISVLKINPDGTLFFSRRPVGNEIHTSIRSSKTGEVEFDLTPFDFYGGWGCDWSPDGSQFVGLARAKKPRTYRAVIAELHPTPRIVDEVLIDRPDLRDVFFDSRDRLCTVFHIEDATKNELEIYVENELATSFKFGKDEYVDASGQQHALVMHIEDNTPTGKVGDLVFCDGKSRYTNVTFDPVTGEVQRQLREPFQPIQGSKTLVVNYALNATEIHDTENDAVVLSIPPSCRVIWATAEQCLVANDGANRLSAYTFSSGRAQSLGPIPSNLRFTNTGELLAFSDGDLYRQNFLSGEKTVIKRFNPHGHIWKSLALGGLALLPLFWLTVGWRSECRYPFADMLVLTMVCVLVSISWSMYGVRAYYPETTLVLSGLVGLTTAMTIGLVWASTVKQFWGTVLPVCVAGVALTVILMGAWSNQNSFRIVEILVGGGIGLTWHVGALVLARRLIGPIARESEETSFTNATQSESQISLRQGLITTAAFCLVFALIRSVDFKVFFYEGVDMFIAWLTIFTSKLAVSGVVSSYAAFRLRHWLPSLVCAVVCSAGYAYLGYFITKNWDVDLLITPMGRCLVPMASGVLVWIAMRYCRRHGYRTLQAHSA